jgi:hypothetical protein
MYPTVTYRAATNCGTYHPDPDNFDFDSHSIHTHPPVPCAMEGPTSYGNFSLLRTSFYVSVYVGSCNTSQYGGSHHARAHRHGTPGLGGHSTSGCLVVSSVAGSLLPTSSDLLD